MAVTSIARSHEANIAYLETKMEREYYKKLFWARFAGYSTVDDKGMDQPSETPLVIKRQLAVNGGDQILMTMLRRLREGSIAGDLEAVNDAEAQAMFFNTVRINQRRKPVAPPPKMQNQRVKRFNLAAQARPQIEDFFAYDTEIEIASAFYEDSNRNITKDASLGGYEQTKVPHPLIYTADAGRVTWSATVATYNANIVTAVNNLTDTDSDYFGTDALESLRVEFQKNNIPDFNGFWIGLIHHNQAKQLRTSAAWQQAQREANVRSAMQHPLWTGALGSYAGFMLFERQLGVFGVDVSGGASAINWGASNPHSAPDTYNHKAAIFFGKYAMCQAWAEGPYFEEESFDANNRKVVVGGIIDGFKRPDYVDVTATPTVSVNQSSSILISYSPDQWN